MNRNEEVKPSFRAEFTPHKSTKKNGTRTLLAGKFRNGPAGNASAPYHTAGNRKQKTENRNRQPDRSYRIYFVVIDNPAR